MQNRRNFPEARIFKVMPSLHCLISLVEIFGTLRPWSPTESPSIITVCIIHLYNKVEVANASFSHSGLVFHIYWLKSLSFSRVALGLLGREVEWEISTLFKGCHEYWTPKRTITVVIGLKTQSNRVTINILLHTASYLVKSRWLNSCFLIYIMKTIQGGKKSSKRLQSKTHKKQSLKPSFPF